MTDFLFWSAELNPDTVFIDVHGLSISSALHEIDFFIDRVMRQNIEVGKIIHGVGTGSLRAAIQKNLAADPRIAAIHQSNRPNESSAVTYFLLK